MYLKETDVPIAGGNRKLKGLIQILFFSVLGKSYFSFEIPFFPSYNQMSTYKNNELVRISCFFSGTRQIVKQMCATFSHQIFSQHLKNTCVPPLRS